LAKRKRILDRMVKIPDLSLGGELAPNCVLRLPNRAKGRKSPVVAGTRRPPDNSVGEAQP
jgi:hypothetical protein